VYIRDSFSITPVDYTQFDKISHDLNTSLPFLNHIFMIFVISTDDINDLRRIHHTIDQTTAGTSYCFLPYSF